MATIEARSSDEPDPTRSLQYQEPRSLDNAFRKANGIFHGGSGALNSTLLSMPALENDSEADASMGIRKPRGKRPALGHKPAQFSLRPNTMQPSAGLELNLDIDQMHDPVDFFSAYVKLQYAKDEIQRHTGGSITNINDYMPSANPCSQRPEMFRRSVMHHYSSAVSETDDTFLSCQEAIRDDSLCPSKFVSQEETANFDIDLQGKELAESISKTEIRIDELLDKLRSESIENLDGDGESSLGQEGLQRKFPKNKKLQTDIPKLMRGLSGKTPVKNKHVAENPVHTLASPTTPKSPFAALSLLNKHISRSKPINDPFMALDIDLPLVRNASSLEEFNQLSQHLDEGKELTISDKLTSPTKVEATRTAVTGAVSNNSIEGVTSNLLDRPVNVNSRGSNGVVMHHNNMTDSARANADTNLCTNGADKMAENVEDMHQDTIYFVQPNVNTDCSTTENIKFSHSPSGQSDSNRTKGLLMNGQPIAADSTFRKDLKCNKVFFQAIKKGSAKDLSNARTHEQKKRKAITRQSLIETGTYWESGVRRSKRIRTRPLEYWKGERFLYGRVHESLATVIGIKCMSPAEESREPTFRVSSYVSDKHKELVELAARH